MRQICKTEHAIYPCLLAIDRQSKAESGALAFAFGLNYFRPYKNINYYYQEVVLKSAVLMFLNFSPIEMNSKPK